MIIRDEDYCRKNGLMGSPTSSSALTQRMAQLAAQLRRQLWRRQRSAAVERPCPLAEYHRSPRGRLVGASNIFNFVYNTLQLNTLDPTTSGSGADGYGQPDQGVTPMALAAAFQIFYDGEYTTPHLYTRVLDREGNIYLENNATSYQALTPIPLMS